MIFALFLKKSTLIEASSRPLYQQYYLGDDKESIMVKRLLKTKDSC